MTAALRLNGFPCKANISADDFFFAGLKKAGNTDNAAGSAVTAANVQSFPGVNTLGVSMARIDYAPGGLNAPHTPLTSRPATSGRARTVLSGCAVSTMMGCE